MCAPISNTVELLVANSNNFLKPLLCPSPHFSQPEKANFEFNKKVYSLPIFMDFFLPKRILETIKEKNLNKLLINGLLSNEEFLSLFNNSMIKFNCSNKFILCKRESRELFLALYQIFGRRSFCYLIKAAFNMNKVHLFIF